MGAKLLPDRDADSLQVVVEGALAVQCHRRSGGIITLEVLASGDCLPPSSGFSSIAERLVFSALAPTTVARVSGSALARGVLKTPLLANILVAKLAEQHVELLARLADLSERTPSGRVVSGLLYLAQKLGQSCPLAPGTRVPVSQSVLAQVANVSRQTTNRVLRLLQSSGLVRIERSVICLLDRGGLKAFTDGRHIASVWKPSGPCRLMHVDEPLTCYPLRLAPRRDRRA